jgi:hypothetical protein
MATNGQAFLLSFIELELLLSLLYIRMKKNSCMLHRSQKSKITDLKPDSAGAVETANSESS